jgi:beta-galactosidase/beta-glucuronidase
MQAGFNGARLHQKVFEERFHYWADRLGYLTWGESASWGLSFGSGHKTAESAAVPPDAGGLNVLAEWREVVVRDRNHPSIVAWSPFNETGGGPDRAFHDRMHRAAYDLTRDLDPTRPVNDTSGYIHVVTDLWTVHNYEQDPGKLKAQLTPGEAGVWRNVPDREPAYAGQPYIVDEFGGIRWTPPEKRGKLLEGWGYGTAPGDLPEFYSRLEGQVDALLSLEHVAGYCYTQLTDVEQEQNGIYSYDRSRKFDMARISRIFRKEPKRG